MANMDFRNDIKAGFMPAQCGSDDAKLADALLQKNQNTVKMQGSHGELLFWQAELGFREAGKEE